MLGCFFSFLLPIFSLAGIVKVSFSRGSRTFGHDENLEEEVRMKIEKLKNSCENLDYMCYNQVNKKQLVKFDRKIS